MRQLDPGPHPRPDMITWGGLRMTVFHCRAIEEERLFRAGKYHNATERARLEDRCCPPQMRELPRFAWQLTPFLFWPRSYVQASLTTMLPVLCGSVARRHNYSFVGAVRRTTQNMTRNHTRVLPMRKWAVSFAAAHFAPNDFYMDTSAHSNRDYSPLGVYDHSLEGTGLVPIEWEKQHRVGPVAEAGCHVGDVDMEYLRHLAASDFTLAPGGDSPWSMRFFEAAFAGALPVVASPQHVGRTPEELLTPWRYRRLTRPHAWSREDVLHNLRLALTHHTAMRGLRGTLSQMLLQAMAGSARGSDASFSFASDFARSRTLSQQLQRCALD